MPPWPACLSYSHSRQLNYNCSCLIPAKRSWTTCTCPRPSHLHESPDAAPSGRIHFLTPKHCLYTRASFRNHLLQVGLLDLTAGNNFSLRETTKAALHKFYFECDIFHVSQPRDPVKMETLIQWVWREGWDCIPNMLTHDANNSGLWIALWVTSDPQSCWHMGITWPAY